MAKIRTCMFCGTRLFDVFNNDLVLQKCYPCDSIQMDFSLFKIYVLNICRSLKYDDVQSDEILTYLDNFISNKHFGDTISHFKCQHGCINGINQCFLMSYNYEGFDFSFCFYNNLIIFNENHLTILLKNIKRKVFWKVLRVKIKKKFKF